MLWPFMRVTADAPADPEHLKRLGIDVATLADPDARISHEVGRKLLAASLERTGNQALGLHAGERMEPMDGGVLHFAVRNCPNVRGALICGARYMRLADSLVEGHLSEDGERATWELRFGLQNPLPQTNDFQVCSAVRVIQTLVGTQEPPIEVRFQHARATDAKEYARIFRCPVVLGARHNGLVFPRRWLDQPLAGANTALLPAFEQQAQRLLDALADMETTSAKVRRLLLRDMGNGQASMRHIARQLHMSMSTLRRRLADEQTTHSDLLDAVRREMALHQVAQSRVSIGELSLLLGFSNPAAFSRAFRRWTGKSPIEFRNHASA